MAPVHHLEHAIVDVLQRHVKIRYHLLGRSKGLEQLVGEIVGIVVEHAHPVDFLDLLKRAKQVGEPRTPVEIHTVVRHVLSDEIQLADPIRGQLASLLHDLFDRLGDVLPAHVRDRTKGAKPVAALGNFQVGHMPRSDSQPRTVVLRLDGGGAKDRALFVKPTENSVGNPGDLLTAEHADDLVDFRHLLQQHLFLPLSEAARHDHTLQQTGVFPLNHPRGITPEATSLPGRIDEAARVDNDEIGLVRVGNERVAILRKEPEHPLGIDQVLGTAKADERKRSFHLGILTHHLHHVLTRSPDGSGSVAVRSIPAA